MDENSSDERLVLEPWITPSLWSQFDANDPNAPKDERSFCQTLGQNQAAAQLQQHWSSWITFADFQAIAGAELNAVRIPIGYWALIAIDGEPFVAGAQNYLDQAIGWARQTGLKVIIDLHGAPGSQNGFDNSGQRDTLQWQMNNNVDLTHQAMDLINTKYGTADYKDVVAAIELLNEPLGPKLNMDGIKNFYNQGYNAIRGQGTCAVAIHDAFQELGYWNGFLSSSAGAYNVVLDIHQYQVFNNNELDRNIDQHVGAACDIGGNIRNSDKWTIVGEFSAAMTDCALYLNGFQRGARWEGSFPGSYYRGSCAEMNDDTQWSSELLQDTRRFLEVQLDAYEQGSGWFFWTCKQD